MLLREWLSDRNLDITPYHCWVNVQESCVTFPLYSIDCRFVGYQTISPFLDKKNRYHTWTSEPCLWGLDTIPMDYRGVVFVTESIWRSVFLHRGGLQSVSLLGSTINKKFLHLMNNHLRYKFVWIGDPDKAGEKLINKFSLKGLTSPVDVDNMSDEELRNFCSLLRERYVRLSN